MSPTALTVITPSYNQARFIRRTIESVLSQNVPDLQYLIFDGGSTDGTPDILREYAGTLTAVVEKDAGQADAVNKGLRKAAGGVIGWLNSDDVYYPSACVRVLELFANRPEVDVVYGEADHIDEEGRVIEPYYTEPFNYERLKDVCFLCQPAVFFRHSVVDRYGELQAGLRYCMDYEYWLRILSDQPPWFLQEKLAGSRLHADTKTLGSKEAVHSEIVEMLAAKFGTPPARWVHSLAHTIVRERGLLRDTPDQDRRFVAALVDVTEDAFNRYCGGVPVSEQPKLAQWRQVLGESARIVKIGFDAAQPSTVAAEQAAPDVPMRVLLDIRWMVPGVAGGIENLARSFFQHLTALDTYNRYTALVPACVRGEFDRETRPNVRVISLDSPSARMTREWHQLTHRASAVLRLHDWRTPDVRNLRWLRDLDVQMAYSFPGFIHPQLRSLRQVLLVPDIQHEYLPQFFSSEVLEERGRAYTDSARRADHLCAISEFTRQTLIDKLGIPPEKVTTVLLAADARFSVTPDASLDTRVLDSNGLEHGKYLFFPAHTWHHKNHQTAIEALRILRDRHGMTPALVCTGEAREAQPLIEAQTARLGLTGQVRLLGYRAQDEIPALYRGAACLVFPSFFEGFGMPVLEAMASGCPVVCSDRTSLPEIAGDAARLVNPDDAEALASEVRRVLTDADLRRELIARGLGRAATFSWRRHTLETIAVLRLVHDRVRTR